MLLNPGAGPHSSASLSADRKTLTLTFNDATPPEGRLPSTIPSVSRGSAALAPRLPRLNEIAPRESLRDDFVVQIPLQRVNEC